MTKEEVRILSIQFQDNEVNVWNCILEKLNKMSDEIGFKKTFNKEEIKLINGLINTEEDE